MSTVYMGDLMFMLKNEELIASLHADGHYNQCNSDFAQ